MLFIRRFIVLLSIAFGVILVLNFAAYQVVKVQKGVQEKLVQEVDSYKDTEARAKEISAKTLAYKKFLNGRKNLLDKTKFVLDNIGFGIKAKSVNINHTGFSINFTGESPLDFTNLITTYLEKDMVSEMIINSASLDKSKNVLNVSLMGNFK